MNETNQSERRDTGRCRPGGRRRRRPRHWRRREAKAQENWNSYLRAVAELENYRKRSEREMDNARKFAIERFAQELVRRRAMRWRRVSMPAAGKSRVRRCSRAPQATLKQLHRAFDKAGIKVIDPAGSALRPDLARGHGRPRKAPMCPPNTVLSVIQKGYSLNGRLLRPARVIVSKAPADGN